MQCATSQCRPSKIVCGYITDSSNLFSILAYKLGAEFSLRELSQQTLCSAGESCDTVLWSIGASYSESTTDVQLDLLRRCAAFVRVIAIVAPSDRRISAAALESGAFACWANGSSIEELKAIIRRASQFRMLETTIEQIAAPKPLIASNDRRIVGGSRIAVLVATAARLAHSDVNVLITGESGTGKEAFARLLHEAGPRAGLPFVAVACSSLPETLIESELFGHERGAFTGASSVRRGRFEEVGAGTLFLDEIAELSAAMQVKLLRVLQERTFERLGSTRSIRCRARLVFATNQPLRELTDAGRFRLDLFYRLNGVQLHLPALRERKEDIRLLAETFLAQAALRQRRPQPILSEGAISALTSYNWPGNVRELQNTMEAVVALYDTSTVEPLHLGAHIAPDNECETSLAAGSFEEEVRSFKRRLIERKLLEYHNNKLQAAKSLGLARSSLHRLIDELHIESARSHKEAKALMLDS
jgi:DNA-binding NtrC family response regulator